MRTPNDIHPEASTAPDSERKGGCLPCLVRCATCAQEMQEVRPGKHQCVRCETKEPDYYSVYVKATQKDKPRHLCNVLARDRKSALQVARDHGLPVPRHSFAEHIGRAGYAREIAKISR
jgi:hypothetical protein